MAAFICMQFNNISMENEKNRDLEEQNTVNYVIISIIDRPRPLCYNKENLIW
ncbi:MAG: hypothetical protein IKC40_07445 [Oscillospiraceae bacterium]|nr:hypothetical protein [Oscillospiraceae bacterium]